MIDTDKYEGHTPAPWVKDGNNICDTVGNVVLGYHYAMATANHTLMADAPLLLEEVKRLRRVLELIGENMEYHSWMHTLIKEAIGFEKWQAKEMIE